VKRILLLGLVALAAFVLWASWPHLSEDADAETARILDLLALEAGAVVADIGAGDGRIAVRLAEGLEPGSRVLATDVDAENRLDIQREAAERGVDNVLVRPGKAASTGLADGCCDAVVMRKVFHHIEDRDGFAADLARTLKPGGKLLMIDFEPRWYLPSPDSIEGHGIRPGELIDHVTAAGFALKARIDDWPGRTYLVIFERVQSDPVASLALEEYDQKEIFKIISQ